MLFLLKMRGDKHIIKWMLSGFVSLVIIFSIVHFISKKDYDNEKTTNPMPSGSHKVEKNIYEKSNFKNKKHISEKPLKEIANLQAKERSNELFRDKGYAKDDDIVKGVGLSVDELKALHARQDREIELMARDTDSIVIPPTKEGGQGITLGELLALQKQQRVEIEKAYDRDEIVISASKDGYPGLSRNELTALHERQEREIENNVNRDEIVISASKDGYPGLSRNELTTLQDQQNYEIWEDIDNLYKPVAPPPEEGGPNLTVQEIKKLQKRESIN